MFLKSFSLKIYTACKSSEKLYHHFQQIWQTIFGHSQECNKFTNRIVLLCPVKDLLIHEFTWVHSIELLCYHITSNKSSIVGEKLLYLRYTNHNFGVEPINPKNIPVNNKKNMYRPRKLAYQLTLPSVH